jgi:hypothetical protein
MVDGQFVYGHSLKAVTGAHGLRGARLRLLRGRLEFGLRRSAVRRVGGRNLRVLAHELFVPAAAHPCGFRSRRSTMLNAMPLEEPHSRGTDRARPARAGFRSLPDIPSFFEMACHAASPRGHGSNCVERSRHVSEVQERSQRADRQIFSLFASRLPHCVPATMFCVV